MSLQSIAPVSSIQSGSSIGLFRGNQTARPTDNLFLKALQGANQQQRAAELATEQLATGQSESIQSTVLSAAKADLSFRLVLEIRNKLADAYQEIMRMQV